MLFKEYLGVILAFLVLVNPIQKILIIFSLNDHYQKTELKRIINRATLTAIGVLILFVVLGETILHRFFNIEIYAFQITCGLVLLYNGFMGLQKGAVIQIDKQSRVEDIVAVPIAIPMIAGPATITAAVTMPAIHGQFITITAILLALGVNWLIMFQADSLGHLLSKHNILAPLIRITGLIVAAIGVQMVCNGLMTLMNV